MRQEPKGDEVIFEVEGRIAFLSRLTGSADEAAALLDGAVTLGLPAAQHVYGCGGQPQSLSIVDEGIIKAYRSMPDGRAQTLSLFVPGDFVDLHSLFLGHATTAVGSVTRARLLQIPWSNVEAAIQRDPVLLRSLAHLAAREQARLQEQVVGMGRRSAVAQTAHLLCELAARMFPVTPSSPRACELPLTQAELADILGLSVVHVCRVMQQLRASRLIEPARGRLRIAARDRLAEEAQFDAAYLGLDANQSKMANVVFDGRAFSRTWGPATSEAFGS